MAKVDITTAGHTIIIEVHDGSLEAVAETALRLWQATRDPRLDRAWAATGFTLDRAAGPEYGDDLPVTLQR